MTTVYVYGCRTPSSGGLYCRRLGSGSVATSGQAPRSRATIAARWLRGPVPRGWTNQTTGRKHMTIWEVRQRRKAQIAGLLS